MSEDELIEEIREELRLGREERREAREERQRVREEHQQARAGEQQAREEEQQELRLFIRQQTALMQTAAREIVDSGARAERRLDKVIERLDDMGDQIRANTEATWRMLDRLSGNGGASPATG